MIGGNVIWIMKKEGEIIDHAVPGSSIYIAEYRDYMIGNNPMTGFSLDLGIDYHIKSSMVTFLNLGFDNSRNVSVIDPVGPFAENTFRSSVRSIHLTAGIYF